MTGTTSRVQGTIPIAEESSTDSTAYGTPLASAMKLEMPLRSTSYYRLRHVNSSPTICVNELDYWTETGAKDT